jgi:hypothetical protein
MKEKLITFWKEKLQPILKAERSVKTWIILAIAFVSFIAGAILF